MISQKCIFCKEGLDDKNKSSEHIIPRCMGGKLKSNSIICRKCNSKFGTEFDEALIERYRLILHPIRIYNPKLRIKDTKVEKNGINYLLTNYGIKLKDPYPLKGIGGFTNMRFPSKESMRRVLEQMKKKDPSIDIQATIDNSKTIEIEIKDYFNFTSKVINDEVFRCCGKICFEFLHYKRSNYKPSDSEFKNFIIGESETSKFPICIWYSNYSPLELNEDTIYHLIVLEGRYEERILIGYLSVFNLLPTLMILDSDYNGPNFITGYFQDLLNDYEREFLPKENLPLSREKIVDLIHNFNPKYIREEYERKFALLIYKSRCLPIQKELEKLIDDISLKVPSIDLDLRDLLEFTYNNLVKILDKYGLYILYKDQLEKIKEETDEITYFARITIVFQILITYFLKAELNVDVFQKLSLLLN